MNLYLIGDGKQGTIFFAERHGDAPYIVGRPHARLGAIGGVRVIVSALTGRAKPAIRCRVLSVNRDMAISTPSDPLAHLWSSDLVDIIPQDGAASPSLLTPQDADIDGVKISDGGAVVTYPVYA